MTTIKLWHHNKPPVRAEIDNTDSEGKTESTLLTEKTSIKHLKHLVNHADVLFPAHFGSFTNKDYIVLLTHNFVLLTSIWPDFQ